MREEDVKQHNILKKTNYEKGTGYKGPERDGAVYIKRVALNGLHSIRCLAWKYSIHVLF